VSLCLGGSLLFASSVLTSRLLLFFLFLLLLAALIFSVCTGWNPEAGFAVLHAAVLAGEVNALAHLLVATLGKVAGACAEGWLDGSVGGDPVCKSVLAVLDDAVKSW